MSKKAAKKFCQEQCPDKPEEMRISCREGSDDRYCGISSGCHEWHVWHNKNKYHKTLPKRHVEALKRRAEFLDCLYKMCGLGTLEAKKVDQGELAALHAVLKREGVKYE